MSEYIDRAALIEEINQQKKAAKTSWPKQSFVVGDVLTCIYNAPAADVVERKRGEWEDEYCGAFANPRYRCSVCKEKALYRHEQDCLGGWHEVQALTDFCPHCGAGLRSHQMFLCDQTEEGEHDKL